jgi:hypothetical protein
MPASCVLASLKPSTYRGVRLRLSFAAVLLAEHFEHPYRVKRNERAWKEHHRQCSPEERRVSARRGWAGENIAPTLGSNPGHPLRERDKQAWKDH